MGAWAIIRRRTQALILAPVLVLCLWLEALAGTGFAWDALEPGRPSYLGGTAWMLYAAAGPTTVLVTTIRTRSRIRPITDRALQIERWGLLVSVPLGVIGLFLIAAASII